MSFLRKGLLVSGTQLTAVPLTAIAGIIFSRTMGPDGVGQYTLFVSTCTLAAFLMALGLGAANIYFLNNRHIARERITTNTIKVGMLLGAILTVGLGGAVLLFPGYFGRVHVYTAVLFALGTALSLNRNLLRPVLIAQMAAKRMSSVVLTRACVLAGGAALLALFGWVNPDTAIIALAAAQALSWLLALYFVRSDVQWWRPIDWALLGDMLRYGLKLAAVSLLGILSGTLTVMLLRYLRSDDFVDVGLYSRAAALSGLITLVPTALGQWLYAKWAGVTGLDRKRQVEMAARMYLTYGLAACLGLIFVGKYLLWFLYGKEFIPAAAAFPLLAPALMCMALFSVFNNLLASDGRAGLSVWILAANVCTVVAVTFLAVPHMGFCGAALAVLCADGLTALLSVLICTRLYGVRIHNCLLIRPSDISYIRRALSQRGTASARPTKPPQIEG